MQTGFLTTHVLDTARGSPAGGLHITLFKLDNRDYKAVNTAVTCLLYTSPSPRDLSTSRMPSSA